MFKSGRNTMHRDYSGTTSFTTNQGRGKKAPGVTDTGSVCRFQNIESIARHDDLDMIFRALRIGVSSPTPGLRNK